MVKENIEDLLFAKANQCSSFQELKTVTGVGSKLMEDIFSRNRLLKVRIQSLFKNETEEQLLQIPNEGIIVDCSAVNAKNFVEALNYYVKAGYKFILTTISIKEFGRMQRICKRSNDQEILQNGRNARELMRLAVENEDVFISVKIPERNINPDEDILDAISGKPNLQLWTADKEMVLLARAQNINVIYVKDQIPIPTDAEMKMQEEASLETEKENLDEQNTETVYGLRYENGQLYIGSPNPYTTYIEVYNRNMSRKDIKAALELGDIILRLRVKNDGSAKYLSEEKMVSLSAKNNGCLKFNLKIWLDKEKTILVPSKYIEFYKRALSTLKEKQKERINNWNY